MFILYLEFVSIFSALTLILISFTEVDSSYVTNNHNDIFSKRSVLDQLSPAALKQLLVEINDIEGNSKFSCNTEFEYMENNIIRTKDSIDKGATFLHALPDITSASECRNECCTFSTNQTGTVLKCNVAVFQDHKTDDSPKCFLFDCYDKTTGDFVCLFSPNNGFSSFKRQVPKVITNVQELENVARFETLTQTTSTMPTTTTSTSATTNSPSTFSTSTTQATIASKSVTTSVTSSTTTDPNACSVNKCQRFEWQCDNNCCIPLQSVCDTLPHCSDGSDEIDCPSTTTLSTTTTTTSTSTTTSTTTTSTTAPTTENEVKHTIASTRVPLTTTTTTFKTTTSAKIQTGDNGKKKVPSKDKNEELNVITTQTSLQEIQVIEERIPVDPEAGAVLPLAIGLAVTTCVLLMVACRVRIMKRKLRRRGKPLTMDESDYLVNGMYL